MKKIGLIAFALFTMFGAYAQDKPEDDPRYGNTLEERLECLKYMSLYSEYVKTNNYKDAYEQADIVVFLTAHNEFKTLPWRDDKVILDFCGIFKR